MKLTMKLKCYWLRFWNVRFRNSFGRFADHFSRLCELDEMGKQRSLKRRYHKYGMRLEQHVAILCDFMCRVVGH